MTPTLDQLAVEKMSVICCKAWNTILKEDTYKARVHFDDRPTSICCSHLHKRPETTANCLTTLCQEMKKRLPTVTNIYEVADGTTPEDGPLYEVTEAGVQGFRFYWYTTEEE